VSIGIASLSSQDETYETLLRRADDAVYRSKRSGRNRVSAAA
jgi:two-component system cell cycle response regulator